MKITIHSHCSGADRVPKALLEEVEKAAAAITVRPQRKSASRIRDEFLGELRAHGWSGKVTVSRGSDVNVTSIKDAVGLCLQTGNMARMYADLIKLQTLYLDKSIEAAIIVLPSQPLALAIGDNIAQAGRLERELEIYRKAYHVPTLVVALEA